MYSLLKRFSAHIFRKRLLFCQVGNGGLHGGIGMGRSLIMSLLLS